MLERHHIEKEADTLKSMYDSVKRRAADTKTVQGKQKLIVELYDKFFRNAFPKMAQRLGIVYTPVEVVDFIIHSVNETLRREFKQTLGSRNVHILDPFTGTGTFITRLLQSGLIPQDQLEWKFRNEIHANEIVLLAYYIAAINIEQVYHALAGGDYKPFDGICLTDTFNLSTGREEWHDQASGDNSARLKRQRNLDIRVIMGNPPYSAGQSSANDNNQNLKYQSLDARIEGTYAAQSTATLRNSLYDSYIRAIRWASDRIRDCGVIGFVSNAGWVDGNAAAGLRKCLVEEFSSIWVFHLRGNQRTSGERSRQEGGKIFGGGSRAPIAITLLVKNPASSRHGEIFFHDIGDNLSREEKLARIIALGDIGGIEEAGGWSRVTPDSHGDWLNQRDGSFDDFVSLGDKKGKASVVLFENYSNGVKTNRDAWVYNFSKEQLKRNIERSIDFYNSEVDRYALACAEAMDDEKPDVASFVTKDGTRFTWDRQQRFDVDAGKQYAVVADAFAIGFYRPFLKINYYFGRSLNNCVYKMPRIFPEASARNRVICVTGIGSTKEFSALVTDTLPDLELISKSQCFPLYLYELQEQQQDDEAQASLFSAPASSAPIYRRKDALTDAGLEHFEAAYPGEGIGKEDVFYYVYGLLHSPDYRARYADNLSKQLPRIPRVASEADFWAFSRAGRKLAELHIGYESAPLYRVAFDLAKPFEQFAPADYRVTQMKFAKGRDGTKHDKSTVIYNHNVTIKNIPLAAYDYVVNGKSALEWVMERQAVTTHKESGIVNDANDWAIETMNKPAYPLELFQRVVTVSLETLRIVAGLPALVVREDG